MGGYRYFLEQRITETTKHWSRFVSVVVDRLGLNDLQLVKS